MQFKVYNVFSTEGFAAKYRKTYKLLTKPPSKLAVITFFAQRPQYEALNMLFFIKFRFECLKFANVAFNSRSSHNSTRLRCTTTTGRYLKFKKLKYIDIFLSLYLIFYRESSIYIYLYLHDSVVLKFHYSF